MMRFLFVILMACLPIIILTDSCYALRLNELESNPAGQDSGAEWVELYSDSHISLENYYLENGDGGIYNLSGSFNGLFVVIFPGLWLDNTNETVYLKLHGDIVDSVGPFKDSKNNDETYTFCEGEWKFTASTKNHENSCGTSSNIVRNNTNNHQLGRTQNSVEETELLATNSTPENSQEVVLNNYPKRIILNKSPLGGEVTKTYKTRTTIIYSFIGFCVLLVILIALRKL